MLRSLSSRGRGRCWCLCLCLCLCLCWCWCRMLGCLWVNRMHHSKLEAPKPPNSLSRRRLGIWLMRVRLVLCLCLCLHGRHRPLSRLGRRGDGILGWAESIAIRRLTFLSRHLSKLLLWLSIAPLLLLVLGRRMRWLLHWRSISKPTMLVVCNIPRTATVATEDTIRVLVGEYLGRRVEQKGQIRGTSPDTLPPQICVALPRHLSEHVPLPFGLLGCPRQRTVVLIIIAIIVRFVSALARLAALPRRGQG